MGVTYQSEISIGYLECIGYLLNVASYSSVSLFSLHAQ